MNNKDVAIGFCRDGYVNLSMAYMMCMTQSARTDALANYVPIASRVNLCMFLAAFSCEQFLKCLILSENNEHGGKHQLTKLFSKLSSSKKEQIENNWSKSVGLTKSTGFGSDSVSLTFTDHLEITSSDFVKYRYTDSESIEYRIDQGITSPVISYEIGRAILNSIDSWQELILPSKVIPELNLNLTKT